MLNESETLKKISDSTMEMAEAISTIICGSIILISSAKSLWPHIKQILTITKG